MCRVFWALYASTLLILTIVTIVIVGAGGAARGVAYALLSAGAHRIVVLNRTLSRAEKLVSDLADARIRAGELTEESLVEMARAADLLVNATTLGMWPNVEGSIWPEEARIPGAFSRSMISCIIPWRRGCWPKPGRMVRWRLMGWVCWRSREPWHWICGQSKLWMWMKLRCGCAMCA